MQAYPGKEKQALKELLGEIERIHRHQRQGSKGTGGGLFAGIGRIREVQG